MLATSISGRLFVGTLACTGLALAALGSGIGAAAAAPSQPAPTDFGLPPTGPDPGSGLYDPSSAPLYDPSSAMSDPSSVLPAASGLPGGSGLPGLSGISGGIGPLIADTAKLLSSAADPNALVTNTQSLLNDAGSLLGVPVGMPNISSFASSTGASLPGLTPPAPLAPAAPPVPPIGPTL